MIQTQSRTTDGEEPAVLLGVDPSEDTLGVRLGTVTGDAGYREQSNKQALKSDISGKEIGIVEEQCQDNTKSYSHNF